MLTLDQRYELARSLAIGHREARLLNGPVRAVWSPDSRTFHYVTRNASGHQRVLVDVGARRSVPLFDAEALAAALSQAGSRPVEAANLVLEQLQHTPATASVSFDFDGARWRWDTQATSLQRTGTAFGPAELVTPDGTAALFLDGPNLRLRERDATSSVALTSDGEAEWGYGDFAEAAGQLEPRLMGVPVKPVALWSPDSQRFAVMRADRRGVPLNHLLQAVPGAGARPVLHSYRYPTPPDANGIALELWFIGRNGQAVRAAIEGLESRAFHPLRAGAGRWSQDGRHFDLQVSSRDFKQIALWRVDAESGAARRLMLDEGPAVMVPGAMFGEPPISRVLGDGQVLAWSQRSGWGHLYRVTPAGDWKPITQGAWLVRSVLHVDEVRRRIVFTACGREPGMDPYFRLVYRVNFDGSELTCLTPEPAHHEFTYGLDAPALAFDGTRSMAPDGSAFVDVWSTVDQPPRSVLRDTETGAVLMELQVADPAGGWPSALPMREPFHVPALDAQAFPGCSDLWGVLLKPAGFDPTRRYPVVEFIYGAPQSQVVPKGWSPTMGFGLDEQLAALGFVVVVIDGPGTPGRSLDFQLASHGRLQSCGSLPDHVNAIRQLAASRPWMDLDRVGIGGGSGGGYASVRALAEHPDFYKVGVSICGNHDNAAYIAGWGDLFHGPYDETLYAEQDNAKVAGRIRGELLLVHGEMDDNVHPAMTLRVVDALIQADRNFDLLVVPNAGHTVFAWPYVQRRIFDFFIQHLTDQRPPKPADPAPQA